MKFSVDFGRSTAAKAAVAAGAVAIAGAVGSAVAFSPIVAPPVKWQGGVEFRANTSTDTLFKAYAVPAGRNFLLTDLTASNSSTAKTFFNVYSGAGGNCDAGSVTAFRVESLLVPAEDTTVLAFQTGIGFAGGTAVCILSSQSLQFNGRGFLFTPS